MMISAGKRRRTVDHEYGAAVRQRAKKTKTCAYQAAEIIMGTGIKEIDTSHLPALQVATWRVFEIDANEVLSSAYDAACNAGK